MNEEIVGTVRREGGDFAAYLTFTTETARVRGRRTYHTVRECVGIFDTQAEAIAASIDAERSAS